ncbi:hypothetical protein [Actinacidiphila acidipaludis]|uniref:LPXTG cell wall anchor domain-containing protein n=1 Tax=Actinacidiphila acidipaludis TaxID=2873382 RepID=A0ABS7Q387_9ACTN|nr:hypothetical protein [Streptomyces acidipaludis]MBY8877174.1 hypothetical protein [Streptomyces acidipaludis]
MTSPRPYVAAAAASVLAALYFVPSASATPHHATSVTAASATTRTTGTAAQSAPETNLADTGAVDTKPYIVGGAAFLVVGAGLVLEAGRRSRAAVQAV